MTSPFLAFTPTADGTLNRQGLIYALLRMVLFTVMNLAGLGQQENWCFPVQSSSPTGTE